MNNFKHSQRMDIFTAKKGKQGSKRRQDGFTLVETVIAMGIIVIMVTAFFAAFAPAVEGIRKSISAKEVRRLSTTLEKELSVLRPSEASNSSGGGSGKYRTPFEKAYNWIKDSFNSKILVYQYKGNPKATQNADGTLPPYVGGRGIPGQDYVIQSVVRKFENPLVEPELAPGVVEGRVFYVRMAQLVFNSTSGALEATSSPDEIQDPRLGTVQSYEDYPEAVIAFKAQFYLLRSNQYASIEKFNPTDVITGSSEVEKHPRQTGKPLFISNMAVRR